MKRLFAAAAAAAMMGTAVPFTVSAETDSGMRDLTTMAIVHDMGVGINLGNTYEACGEWIDQWGDGTPHAYETAWGSPVVTREMIQGYADAGFGSLRIPVAWSNMMGDNYTISSEYLACVREKVDWAMDSGLYVIINLHWDGGWLESLPENKDACMEKYTAIWTQLCDAFEDYSDYLIFESQNEELGWSSLWNVWSGSDAGKAESYGYVNEVNQTFVDIVRSSGGNNPQRHLLISGYNTGIDSTCDPLFRMPNDPAGRCAVSVHYYSPSTFAILEEDADWGKASPTWGTDAEIADLNRNMDMMKTTFVDKGIPVIIGEYGCPKKNKDEESVRRFISSVCEAAYTRGMCPVLWDVTGLHYDRDTCTMVDPVLAARLREISEAGKVVGDVDMDGSCTVADVVMLQKWLLNAGPLNDPKAADLTKSGTVNVLDLCLLKRIVTKQ